MYITALTAVFLQILDFFKNKKRRSAGLTTPTSALIFWAVMALFHLV